MMFQASNRTGSRVLPRFIIATGMSSISSLTHAATTKIKPNILREKTMFSQLQLLWCRLLVVITITGIGFVPGAASASTYWGTVIKNVIVVVGTKNGDLTVQQEADQISKNFQEWRLQRVLEGFNGVGLVAEAGNYPVTLYTPADLGSTKSVTYSFMDLATGNPTPPAFALSSVRYEALLDPSVLVGGTYTESEIRQKLTFLGTSSDAASNYALNFTLQGFEPIILGFPLDALGNEITGEGTAGFTSNVAVVPVPAAVWLFSSGLLGLFGLGSQKKYRRATA